MSSSAYTIHPAALLNTAGRDRMHEPRDAGSHENQAHRNPSSTPIDSSHLSPFSSQAQSNTASPTVNNTSTPAGSLSTHSEHYQSSDFSEVDEDPFFGVDFNNIDGGTPSFLDTQFGSLDEGDDLGQSFGSPTWYTQPQDGHEGNSYPLSPDPTPSLHTTSPQSERKSPRSAPVETVPESISPQELSKVPTSSVNQSSSSQDLPQLSPDTNDSGPSSDDGTAPVPPAMPSPRVTVSLWGRDNDTAPIQSIDSAFQGDTENPAARRVGMSADDNFIPSHHEVAGEAPATRDEEGNWVPNEETGHRGLDPASRPTEEVTSINEIDAQRKRSERNHEVDSWLSSSQPGVSPDTPPVRTDPMAPGDDGIPNREPGLGHETENRQLPGQTYYLENGGPITSEDLEIMRQNRNWADAPVLPRISNAGDNRYQPETSQAAIERFERMCHDNESIISKAATWGTRRRSLPSIVDVEGVLSGNFLKKLSISRGEPRRQSIFKEIRAIVRKPSASQILKRTRSDQEEEVTSDPDSDNRRESQSSLAPPGRTMSWGKKSMPSINTAFVSMGANVASIGSTHARSGSISNATPVTSPKSPFNLNVKNTLRRPRSKSDLPKSEGSYSNLADMWKKTGGPPVSSLAAKGVSTASAAPAALGAPHPEAEDDDDDDDDGFDDHDMKAEAAVIDDITPTFAGFQQQILRMNPLLATQNNYLVDRIAHQQVVRYKSLLNAKLKHTQHVTKRTCPCGPLCIALGGSANILEPKNDTRGLDPLSARYDGSDGDMTPLEGAITNESFPPDIPMPPTTILPAEFECQLCYQGKKFQKPSDWTKHVHEDVQPFTCTWDRCRDPKIFKRKADWVRHENEGHRHLEWWTCDVDDCRHTCYRRDNFLQHLVREHKFAEPKIKTKAAIKRAGGADPTWQKVEQCHVETPDRAQDEPCRFCGKSFPTWKKLTVHLAKHMEQMSLPILRLVSRRELEADTIISPVQEPPPRSFAPLPVKQEPHQFNQAMNMNRPPLQHPSNLAYPNAQHDQYGYQQVQAPHYQQPYYGTQFDGLPQNLDAMALGVQPHMPGGFHSQAAGYHNIPVTTGAFVPAPNPYMSAPSNNMEPFPAMNMNALGLQGPTGNQMGYEGMMDQPLSAGDQFTPHGSVQGGSVSPFSHSPHQGQQGFYPPPMN